MICTLFIVFIGNRSITGDSSKQANQIKCQVNQRLRLINLALQPGFPTCAGETPVDAHRFRMGNCPWRNLPIVTYDERLQIEHPV